MYQEEINMQKRKKLIGKISGIFIVVIILLTFFSKTINNFLLPIVTVTEPVKGSIEERLDAQGKVELMGKEKIYSTGNWKVIDVLVDVDQQVKEGDILALLDNEDIIIDLKRKELEILKLENNIKKYISDYQKNDLSNYERDLILAKRDMEFAKEELLDVKKLYDNGIESKKSLEQAQRNLEDNKLEYEYKQEVYITKKNQKMEESQEYERTLKEKQLEVELKKLELSKLKDELPVDGKIRSTVSGKVTVVNIEPKQTTFLNQKIFEIVKKNSPYKVTWTLNPQKAALVNIGETVNIVLSGEKRQTDKDVKSELMKLDITGREYLNESDLYKYEVIINKSETNVYEGQKAQVYALKVSETYDYLIPKSSITERGGLDYIFVIKERRGALGIEKYVEKINVAIIDSDDFNCAVEGFLGGREQIVQNTTKPLTDFMQIKLR